MNQNKFSFNSENIVVDYFEWKFDALSEFRKQKIVEFFFKLGFNSFDVDKKYCEPKYTQIQTNPKNQYIIQFVRNVTRHWDGVCVTFPKQSAAFFYQLSKEKKIDWNLFDSVPISRLDLNYLRPIDPSETQNVIAFFKESVSSSNSKGINARMYSEQNEKSLKIASRRSNRSARLYIVMPQGRFLKFEMEICRSVIAPYKSNLLNNNFEKLEDSLTKEFLNYFLKVLPLKSQYTDWLSQKMRPFSTNVRIYSEPYLLTDYIKSPRSKLSKLAIKNFILFLKFLRFTKNLNYDVQELDTILYRVIIFKVKDLTTCCESLFDSDYDSYKIRQVKKFLEQLQSSI